MTSPMFTAGHKNWWRTFVVQVVVLNPPKVITIVEGPITSFDTAFKLSVLKFDVEA